MIVARPTLYGYVMAAFGVVSLGVAGVLIGGDSSSVVIGALAVVGVGSLIGGVRIQRATTVES